MRSPRNDVDLVKLSPFCAPGTYWLLIKACNNKDGDSMYNYHEMKENQPFERGHPSWVLLLRG